MKSEKLMWITAITLLVALAMPLRLAAQGKQEHNHNKDLHYKLVDLGTLGGPQSAGFGVPLLNNQGTVVGCADASTSDPNYPNFNPFLSPFGSDPFIFHTFRFQDDVVTDMGALPGVNSSCESSITDNGLIVGGSENGLIDPLTGWPAMEAVVWKDGQVINLKTFGGNESFAITANNHGQVVGAAADSIPDPFSFVFFGWGTETRAFLWDKDNGMRDLGTLGGPDALAIVVNERGQIFGASYINSIPNQTTGIPTFDGFFLENGHDQMLDIPDGFGGTEVSPFFANNHGQLVGDATLPGDVTFHPFLWGKGVFTDLGTFGGDNGQANWINDKGQVAGSADFPGDQIHHGALWTNGVMTDLGTVGGDSCSRAFSVNSKAQVVGGSSSCNGFLHAFLWQKGRIVDLNTLVTPGSGLELTFALDINDRGEISGVGVLPNGDQHAFLLIPCGKADEGCRESVAGTSAATERSPTRVTQNQTTLTQGSPLPSDRMAAIPTRLAHRYPYRGFGTYQPK